MATVRPLAPGDRPRVRQLHREAFPEAVRFHTSVLDKLFRHDAAINLVVERAGVVVGYGVTVVGGSDPARLWTLHIAPDHRRQGLASQLLDELEHRTAARGAKRLQLHVHVHNEAALDLYRRRGYEVTSREPNWYDGLDEPTGLVMERRLPSTT